MSGIKLFWSFAKASSSEILENKKNYLKAFVALLILSNLEALYPFMGVGEESGTFIALTILSTLLVFVVLSQVVITEKNKHGGTGELVYFVPTFLLYNLYYSFLFFLGLLFFIIPGIYVLIFFSLVPFVAVLDDEADGGYFKKSRELVKKNVGLVAWASLLNLLIECTALLFSPIKDPTIKAIWTFIFSVPDSFITIVLTVVTVKIYYYLKKL